MAINVRELAEQARQLSDIEFLQLIDALVRARLRPGPGGPFPMDDAALQKLVEADREQFLIDTDIADPSVLPSYSLEEFDALLAEQMKPA